MSDKKLAPGALARAVVDQYLAPDPSVPVSVGRAYVQARADGRSVSHAVSMARLEQVSSAVLSWAMLSSSEHGASDVLDVYDVDAKELERVTNTPSLDALSGMVTRVDGEVILSDVRLPQGAVARVFVRADYDIRPDDVDCYSEADVEAWRDCLWRYVGVEAQVTLWDGCYGSTSIWGVEQGSYWPGSAEAQIWHVVPDVIRGAYAEACSSQPQPEMIPVEQRATCGTCGRSWNAQGHPTPAGRCPWEYDHVGSVTRTSEALRAIDEVVSAFEAGAANAGDPFAVVCQVRRILEGQ